MTAEMLLRAVGAAEDKYLLDCEKALGLNCRKSYRKLWLMLPAAVLIVSALIGAAFAAGWFGLSTRAIEAEIPYNDAIIINNDVAGSPTAAAKKEWEEFYWRYTDEHRSEFTNDPDMSWAGDEDRQAAAMIYGAGNEEMLDKLYEICEKNGVKLYKRIISTANVISREELSELFGIGDPAPGADECQLKYIFDNGDFTVESFLSSGDRSSIYTLVRGTKGYLPNASFGIIDSSKFEEWQYVTRSGVTVNIAVDPANSEYLDPVCPCFIFCELDDCVITAALKCGGGAELHANAEKLAECFDYRALADIDAGKIAEYLENPPEAAPPRVVKPKEGFMSFHDFTETDEYKASVEFNRLYNEYLDRSGYDAEYNRMTGKYSENYYAAFPAADEEINKLLDEVLAKYSLEVPRMSYSTVAGLPVASELKSSTNSHRSGEDGVGIAFKFESFSWDEICDIIGAEPFMDEPALGSLTIYDTGAFNLDYVHYIPKGCFYPLLRFALDCSDESWAYETACGEQVSIAYGGQEDYPVYPISYIFYETDDAYIIVEYESEPRPAPSVLEKLADSIDFTKLSSVRSWDGSTPEPKLIKYEPLTIMRKNWYNSTNGRELMLFFAECEETLYTYEHLSGGDAEGITWSIDKPESVTLIDNGDGSCTLISHGTSEYYVELTAARGDESFTQLIRCMNYEYKDRS